MGTKPRDIPVATGQVTTTTATTLATTQTRQDVCQGQGNRFQHDGGHQEEDDLLEGS